MTEFLGRGNYPDQITLGRGYVKKRHAFAPWHLVVDGPISGIGLEVQSNLTQRQVREIGTRIVAASRLGNPAARKPWTIKRVLTVEGVASLCPYHATECFMA